jgi:hypothetical protein
MHEIDDLEIPDDALALLDDLEYELLPEVSRVALKPDVGHTRRSSVALRTDRDHWKIRILDAAGHEIEEYPTHWRPDNPFATSPRVMLAGCTISRKARKELIEGFEEQAALGLDVPRLIVPLATHVVEVSRDLSSPRPGQVRLARWRVTQLGWQPVAMTLPENWSVPADLVDLYPGYDWEQLRGYEMQPWASEWADPHESWQGDFGRRQATPRVVEPIFRYVRITEPLPFPDDSMESVRFMSLLTRLHDPDPWRGHKIVRRNLVPAAVETRSLFGINPNTTNGFRRQAVNAHTKRKAKKR